MSDGKRVGLRSGFLILLFLLGLPGRDELLDLFRPLNLSAAFVAVLGLEKNLALTVRAEKSLLWKDFLGHGDIRNPQSLARGDIMGYVALRRRRLKIGSENIACFTVSLQR